MIRDDGADVVIPDHAHARHPIQYREDGAEEVTGFVATAWLGFREWDHVSSAARFNSRACRHSLADGCRFMID